MTKQKEIGNAIIDSIISQANQSVILNLITHKIIHLTHQ